MNEEKEREVFYTIRCVGCGTILLEITADATGGRVRRWCRKCKRFRTIKLGLPLAEKSNTITV